MHFGPTLAALRRSRGWSQERLALAAGLSQRHVSFLETGRARPGNRSLSRLIAGLALRGWEQRRLIAALAPETAAGPQVPGPDAGLVADLAERLSPWPTYAFRPDGTLIAANRAMTRLLARAAPGEDLWQATAPQGGTNIYDLALHPRGLMRWMANPDEVVPETLRRLRIEAAADPALAGAVRRLERYPSAEAHGGGGAAPHPGALLPPAVLIERYRLDGALLSVIAVVAHLASPGEIELADVRLETFVPADAASERIIAAA